MSDTERFDELDSYRRAARQGRLRSLIALLAVLAACAACACIWAGIGSILAYAALADQGHEQISVRPVGAFTYAFSSEGANRSCSGRIEITPLYTSTSMGCSMVQVGTTPVPF